MAEDNTNDYISPVSGQAFEQAFHTRDDLSLEEQIELAKEQFAKLQAERDELLERDTEIEYIYIAAPYTNGDVAENIRRVIEAATQLRDAGFFPYVPHLTHLWHLIDPHEYEYWMELDMGWLRRCDAVLRLDGDSVGADRETALAIDIGLPLFKSLRDLWAQMGVV